MISLYNAVIEGYWEAKAAQFQHTIAAFQHTGGLKSAVEWLNFYRLISALYHSESSGKLVNVTFDWEIRGCLQKLDVIAMSFRTCDIFWNDIFVLVWHLLAEQADIAKCIEECLRNHANNVWGIMPRSIEERLRNHAKFKIFTQLHYLHTYKLGGINFFFLLSLISLYVLMFNVIIGGNMVQFVSSYHINCW